MNLQVPSRESQHRAIAGIVTFLRTYRDPIEERKDILANGAFTNHSHRRHILAPVAEFRRVVHNQNRFLAALHPLPRGLKMTRQNLLFSYPAVGEKSIGRLRCSPILTGPGNTPSHPFGELLPQRLQSLLPAAHPATSRPTILVRSTSDCCLTFAS